MSDNTEKASVSTALGSALLMLVVFLAVDSAILMFGLGSLHAGLDSRIPAPSYGSALVLAILVRTFGRLFRGYTK